MKIRFVIIAAWAGIFALALTDMARAAYHGSDLSKPNAASFLVPIDGRLAVRGLATDAAARPSGTVRMAGCILGIGGGIYQLCTGLCFHVVDGIEYAAPCLKSVKSVEDYVMKRKKIAHKAH
jgi:hypothetical protein